MFQQLRLISKYTNTHGSVFAKAAAFPLFASTGRGVVLVVLMVSSSSVDRIILTFRVKPVYHQRYLAVVSCYEKILLAIPFLCAWNVTGCPISRFER
jgi:hypothetical protein